MEREIIEININFINLCLIQYVYIIKFFNYQLYLFHEENIKYFSNKNVDLIDASKIVTNDASKFLSMSD